MKKIEKKYIFAFILLLLTIYLGFAVKVVNTNRDLTFIEKIVKDTILFTEKIVYTPINFVKDKINETKEKNNIYEKYKELQKNAEKLDSINAKNDELLKEVNEMKKLLDLNKTLEESSYLNASVINRNLDYFNNTLTIDKGENNGIKEDMAVIVNEGLIGRIIKTSSFNSVVKLLTTDDVNNKISVKIKNNDKYIYGLLVGYKDNNLIVEGIDTNDDIIIGSIVTTTGLGGVFPAGLLVGEVKEIKKDNFDLAKTVLVKSKVDFDDISYVTVLKRSSK